jgi:hypothetical protein
VRFGREAIEEAIKLGAGHQSREGYRALIVGQDVADRLASDYIGACMKAQRAIECDTKEHADRVGSPGRPGDGGGDVGPEQAERQRRHRKRAERAERQMRAVVPHRSTPVIARGPDMRGEPSVRSQRGCRGWAPAARR